MATNGFRTIQHDGETIGYIYFDKELNGWLSYDSDFNLLDATARADSDDAVDVVVDEHGADNF